jgi:Ser/Thr protein kinase RdoA (MazF antagonist)
MNDDIAAIVAYHQAILRLSFFEKGLSIPVPELFAHGANNLLYRFSLQGTTIVAKIGINPFYRYLHLEREVLEQLGSTGPRIIDFFLDGEDNVQVLLLEYVEGTHPYTLNNEQLVNIGAVIAGYHGLEKPLPQVPVETYREFLARRILPVPMTGDLKEYSRRRFHEIFSRARALTESLTEKLAACRMVLVHGDLIPENIIVDKCGFLRIIDWEGVRYDAPEADFATLIKAFKLDSEQFALVLEGYGVPIDENVLRFRLLVHYLQVIAWRLAIQLPRDKKEHYDSTAAELEAEFEAAEEMAGRF